MKDNEFLTYIRDELNLALCDMEIDSERDVQIYDRLALLTQEIQLEIEGVD